MSHRCLGSTECDVTVDDRMLMCRPHWYQVPKEIRDEVWRAFRTGGVGSVELLRAQSAAIESLREGK